MILCIRRAVNSFFLLVMAAMMEHSGALAADAQHGKALAEVWCASCHLVTPEQREASADVPSFASVGEQPEFNAARLAFFLLDPHPKMPNLSLTRAEAADLAAYIASLK
jgi:mono/diheme cytochrome c family protein